MQRWSVSDLLQLYLADQRRQGRHSRKQAEGNVRLHLDPAFGKTKPSEITTQKIDRFIEQKQNAGYANATVNRWLEAFRRSFELGQDAVPPLVDKAPKIDKLQENNVREGFLEHEQYLALRNEFPDHQRLILVMATTSGCAVGRFFSCVGIRWIGTRTSFGWKKAN